MILFRFRSFRVYQEARQFRKAIYAASAEFPSTEKYCLTDQIRRACNSILLNIAEGSNKFSDKDFSRYLNTSLTSLEEVVACLDIALDEQYLTISRHENLLRQSENLGKQLISFTSKVRKNS